MLAIQVVNILWTKATRGAPRANERAALPRAFGLAADDGACLIQQHRMVEWRGFAPELVRVECLPVVPASIEALRVRIAGAEAILGISGTSFGGQPKRRAVPEAIRLLPGQWARISLNARHTSYSGQHYSETVFNVALGDAIPSDRFLAGAPTHEMDFKAHLF